MITMYTIIYTVILGAKVKLFHVFVSNPFSCKLMLVAITRCLKRNS